MPVYVLCLQESMQAFNCLHHTYFKPTDTLLLNFHNAQVKLKWEDTWCGSLATPVGLRDFKHYVLEEERQWFLEQEEVYQSKIRAQSEPEVQVTHYQKRLNIVMTPETVGAELANSKIQL